jgi:hypothetical protein
LTKMCAFPDCPNTASPKAGQGLCSSHYWQFHKGRPLTPLAYRRNVTEPWLRAHIDHVGDECLIWPFQRLQVDGRAAVKWRGKQTIAARVMCELAHGAPPTPKHEAAHSCGKGHDGCVNPNHLRWATSVENKADQLIHGTRARGERQGSAKLTEGKVRAIREFAHTCSQQTIADLFGITQRHAGRIINGERWGHVT